MASSSTSSFTSQTELEMESSKARHWSELDESVTSSEWSVETNYTYFAELKNHPEWGRFFYDLRALKVGEKISGGAQADVYEASMSGGPMFDMVVKVMKGNTSLQALQAQWPIGMLSARFKYKRVFDVIMTTIVGGTLLQDERLKGRFAFVMYRRWGDLRLLIDRRMKVRCSSRGPFSIEQAIHLMHTIARDMDILHTKYDIIHRDLKASNVLVWKGDGEEMKFSDDETLYAVVADFECSRLIVGTGFWKAPEIFQQLKDGVPSSEVKFTTMSDVYSFGMTCHEILSGSTPFDPKFDFCTREEVLSGRRPNLPSDIPLFLRSIITSCWHANPKERPSFHDICESLEHKLPELVDSLRMHKLLLLGHEGSGRSTIFKQAKILYNEGFTKEEVVSFKSLIQANIYKYLAILLEARERFEEEEDELNNNNNNAAATRASQQQQQQSSSSSTSENNSPPPQTEEAGILKWNNENKQKATDNNNRYRLEPRMKELSDWFMENMHNMDTALLQEHASKLEQLWLNPAIQATFQRKAQLPFLPDVASVFLDRVVEVCRSDYEPAELDILQTEGLSQGSGLVQIEISLDDEDFWSWLDADTQVAGLDRYQVIRVGGEGMTDRHKWLDMFEDVRAVVFCVSLSDYNKTWSNETTGGNPTNKMLQTKDLFESVLRHPCFQDTSFILLLNKYDVFEEKIEKGVPLTACSWFSDFRPVWTSHYTPQNQAQQAYLYIAHKYQELFKSVNCTGRRLFTYQLNALDKSTVNGAFQYVKTVLKWEEHKAAGWGLVEDSSYSTESIPTHPEKRMNSTYIDGWGCSDVSSFSQRSMPRQPDLFRRWSNSLSTLGVTG